jgi:UrcA family protein
MNSTRRIFGSPSIVGAVALTCFVAAAGAAVAGTQVTVAIPVRVSAADLGSRAGTLAFYQRLQDAAWVACTRADRVGLAPVDDVHECTERALGAAIGSAHVALLTEVYLESHSIKEAKAYGIEVPIMAGTKPKSP